jgi:hypothetical protein
MIIALNTQPCYSGIGQYSKDINDCFGNVKSLVVDKRYRDLDYCGTKYFIRNIPIASGWRIFTRVGYKLIKNLKVEKGSVIHYLSPNIPLYNKQKGIVTIHDFYFKHLKSYPKWFINLSERTMSNFKDFDFVITDSQAVATEAIEYGFNKPQVVHLPVDDAFFAEYDRTTLRKKYGIPEDATVVLTDGDSGHKGTDIVDRCVRKLGYFHLHIGSQKYDKSFSQVSQSTLAELYACADIFSRFSSIEGFGIPPLQAAVLNLSVAVSDLPVYHETLGDYATYANNEDELLDHLSSPRKMSNTIIREEFSIARFKQTMEKVYLEAESS